jgi:hypothetical protein
MVVGEDLRDDGEELEIVGADAEVVEVERG